MGNRWNIPVILGSATPSPESWLACTLSKMTRVTLTSRFANRPLPEWKWVDTHAERIAGRMQGEFSATLLDAIRGELKQGNQVILFKNRRGYAPLLTCEDCSWSARCDQCDLALIYHKSEHRLRCHGCGQIFGTPPACVSCGSTRLKFKGYGTEKIEEELEVLLEGYCIGRLDQDSVRSKSAYGKTLDAFESGQIQVLVGTQMVSKGLDFPRVNLVGVLDADQGLQRAHFRAQERAYQLLAQLAGRSGRHQGTGSIFLQTRMPQHPLFAMLQNQDYSAFVEQELLFRQQHLYPPYVRLIRLTLGHTSALLLQKSAETLASCWRPWLGSRLLGPAPPLTAMLRNEHRMELWIKAEKNPGILLKIRESIPGSLHQLGLIREFKGLRIALDVDPE
jgi:primosomal protein N' (replication factor Y)